MLYTIGKKFTQNQKLYVFIPMQICVITKKTYTNTIHISELLDIQLIYSRKIILLPKNVRSQTKTFCYLVFIVSVGKVFSLFFLVRSSYEASDGR